MKEQRTEYGSMAKASGILSVRSIPCGQAGSVYM